MASLASRAMGARPEAHMQTYLYTPKCTYRDANAYLRHLLLLEGNSAAGAAALLPAFGGGGDSAFAGMGVGAPVDTNLLSWSPTATSL